MTRTLVTTPCAGAALAYFGCTGTTYNHRTRRNVWPDTMRRAGYSVRSRMSMLRKGASVGGSRQRIAEIAAAEPNIRAFVVRIQGHVMVVNREGQTVVDTDPRKRDSRRVYGIYAIFGEK